VFLRKADIKIENAGARFVLYKAGSRIFHLIFLKKYYIIFIEKERREEFMNVMKTFRFEITYIDKKYQLNEDLGIVISKNYVEAVRKIYSLYIDKDGLPDVDIIEIKIYEVDLGSGDVIFDNEFKDIIGKYDSNEE
jgi:hypothetical protein